MSRPVDINEAPYIGQIFEEYRFRAFETFEKKLKQLEQLFEDGLFKQKLLAAGEIPKVDKLFGVYSLSLTNLLLLRDYEKEILPWEERTDSETIFTVLELAATCKIELQHFLLGRKCYRESFTELPRVLFSLEKDLHEYTHLLRKAECVWTNIKTEIQQEHPILDASSKLSDALKPKADLERDMINLLVIILVHLDLMFLRATDKNEAQYLKFRSIMNEIRYGAFSDIYDIGMLLLYNDTKYKCQYFECPDEEYLKKLEYDDLMLLEGHIEDLIEKATNEVTRLEEFYFNDVAV